MPFKMIRDHALNLVIHEGHGLITYDEICSELSTCFEKAGWVHHSLWDLRDASLKLLTGEQVVILAENARAYAMKKTGMKNAWVAVTPADFGLCRMSEIVAEGVGLDLGVFSDFDEAMAWIKD